MSRHPALALLERAEFATFTGTVSAIGQSMIEAAGPMCAVGDFCSIDIPGGAPAVMAQAIAVSERRVRLLPLGTTEGVRLGAPVRRSTALGTIVVGDGLAGRAVDAFGRAIDGRGPVIAGSVATGSGGPGKLDRTIVPERVATGIRAIDGLVPIAKGQRIGIFAASGIGKTTLIEQVSGRIDADHIVLCLIGERGREVERLWRMHLAGERRDRFTLVAATSDESATARVRAMEQALAIAEYWRAQSRHVVLFVDSVTRLAMALREIGLAAGEPPSLRAYTPNVFAAMPHYVERCGGDRHAGQITAIFTVLAETDDVDDPIVELLKSLLDGHIVLSRKLAEKGHFPPIDVGASVSRVAGQVMTTAALADAQSIRRSFAEFEDARAMIESGIYRAGSNTAIDRAIALQPQIDRFLRQDGDDAAPPADTDAAMARVADSVR